MENDQLVPPEPLLLGGIDFYGICAGNVLYAATNVIPRVLGYHSRGSERYLTQGFLVCIPVEFFDNLLSNIKIRSQ
jgi:hypothetical protein